MNKNQWRGLRIGIIGAVFVIAGIAGAIFVMPEILKMMAMPGLGIIGWGVIQSKVPPKEPKPARGKSGLESVH
jgi:hypothetical protein